VSKTKKLRITQVHSTIDRTEKQKKIVRSLGIKKLYHTVEKNDTPQIRGIIRKIEHLLKVEEITEGAK
jgi:large subunit ribosomal protein L30